MIIQLIIDNDDLVSFFKAAGIEATMETKTRYTPGYHGKVHEFDEDVLMVTTGEGKKRPAHDVYQAVMQMRTVTPDDISKQLIKQVLNTDK